MKLLSFGRVTVGFAIYVVGVVANGRLRSWQQKKLNDIHEREFKTIQQDWERSLQTKLEILNDTKDFESAEWLNTVCNVMWSQVMAPLVEQMVPPLIQMELELVLAAESDEHSSIPSFLKDLVLDQFHVAKGDAAPFRIAGLRIITDKGITKHEDDFLLDVAFEVVASKMRMVVLAVIDNFLSKIIDKILKKENSSQLQIKIECSEVRMVRTSERHYHLHF